MSRKVSEQQKKEILKLFQDGQKVKDISKLLNFTIQTITRQLKNLLGEDEFIEIKNSKFKKINSSNEKSKTTNSQKSYAQSKSNEGETTLREYKETKNLKNKNKDQEYYSDSYFVELTPINHDIDNLKRKEVSSTPIELIEFPITVYMVVDKNIELEIKFLKDYPVWDFLPEEDLDRKSIEIFNDIKKAKRSCNKEQKVIKVPNTDVFKLVAPILVSRGISRIISDEQLISL